MDLTLLLWGLQSPINIGAILRTAETFGAAAAIADFHGVLDDESALRTVSDHACGALQRHPPIRVDGLPDLVDLRRGRFVATRLAPDARPLQRFDFQPGDIVVLGNEYDGVPPDVAAASDVALWIPLPPGRLPKPRSFRPIDPARKASVRHDGEPNLNVAAAAAILCYAAHLQALA